MSNKQSNSNNANSAQVPTWDEFNLSHEDDSNSNLAPMNDFVVEHQQQEIGPIYEPGPEEFGPALPPGFGADDTRSSALNPDVLNEGAADDFYIPIENYDLDDPEDPLQGGSSSTQKTLTGPQTQHAILPKIVQQSEQLSLPSLSTNPVKNKSQSGKPEFIFDDQLQGCSSSFSRFQEEKGIIGPAVPPEFLNMMTQKIDEYDLTTGLPPDEPQCSYNICQDKMANIVVPNKQKHFNDRMNNGPTLPSSSDEEDDEREKKNEQHFEMNGRAEEATDEHQGGEWEGEEELMVGPMPPTPGRTEDEEQMEYLGRLATLEENNKHSQGAKREEWMTELPQKMLRTGVFGLSAKTSFSRFAAGPSAQSDLWTKVANGEYKKELEEMVGPSTSKRVAGGKDEWDQQRANELNKGRDESLLDMHQKKRKVDQHAGISTSSSLTITEMGERRPFDRDREIESHCFRAAGTAKGTAELKERMGNLSNRFGHGTERKFL